jgi:DNA-binding LacI/PurR family transcriptional regulator
MPDRKRKRKHAAKLADVADHAGVSQAAVSAVLNNQLGKSIRVSVTTKKRVLDAARALSYTPNLAARNLAGRRNNIIAIFTYNPVFPYEQRNFYFPFLVGIEQETELAGYDLLLTTSTSGKDRKRRIYRDGVNRLKLADGAIILGLGRDEEELIKLIKEVFPVVFVGHREFPNVSTSYVAADYVSATSKLVEYMQKKGHSCIAYMGMKDHKEPGNERMLGYSHAMEKAGFGNHRSFLKLDAPEQIDGALLKRILESGTTALLTENYIICNRIVQTAERMGVLIPGRLSIAVLGGPSETGLPDRDWTSFSIPDFEMGRAAVSILLKIFAAPESGNHRIVLECPVHFGSTVIERDGSAVAPEHLSPA